MIRTRARRLIGFVASLATFAGTLPASGADRSTFPESGEIPEVRGALWMPNLTDP